MEGTQVTVESVRDVGPETVALELETPDTFDALPGQFVLVRARPDEADEPIARHYTLSSSSVTDTFEITVGVDPDGDLSPWLAALDPGETIHIEGPFGNIAYEGTHDVVAIAGGPGIGPAISIAEAAHNAGHDAVVLYQDDDPAHVDRLDELEDDGEANTTVTVVDDDADAELADAIEAHLDEGAVYAFGFAAFATLVADTIDDAGGDADEAHIENFG